MANPTRQEPSVIKNAIVLALLLMRMVAEEIVKEAKSISRRFPRISADPRTVSYSKIKRGAWLHRAYFLDLLLET
jgi:hypothetical protein